MNFLGRVRKAGPREVRLALEAMLALAVADLFVRLAPSPVIARTLSRHGRGHAAPADAPGYGETARSVGRAVRRAARYHPLRPVCLPQALAARAMLRRRRVATTLSLGLARDKDGGLMAHAWLRAGAVTVTGGEELPTFTPVQHFG